LKIVTIIIDSPGSERAKNALSIVEEASKLGATVSLYLLGNGVYLGTKGFLERVEPGVEVYAREEDLEARGIRGDLLSERVRHPPNVLDRMIHEIMEEADRVLCF